MLNPDYGAHYIGGESVQQTLLAKAFVDLDYDVSTVVTDLGQPDGECIDGVRVCKTFRPDAGIPVFRFIHPRFTYLWRALRKADADIYYQSCASVATGIVAWYCSKYGRKFVFRVAHDTDVVPGQQLIPYWRDKKIYEYGLRNADLIINQSQQQQDLLLENYRLQGPWLDMVVEIPKKKSDFSRDIDILWVNNLRPFKRPERFLELARHVPEMKCVMIGGPVHGHDVLFDEIARESENIDNLDFMGYVPYEEVNEYYARSRIFVNTSETEGFPNSFLQAWIRGTPVFSFFDPDGIIAREKLGTSPVDIDQMVRELRKLLSDEAFLLRLSSHVSCFARDKYSPSSVAMRYHELFQSI